VRNLRGRILPVIDLAYVLGIPQSSRPGRLLVVESGGHQAGLAIDEVSSVGDMEDPAEEAESDLLVGATLAGGHLIGVLDVPRLFDSLEGARQ
jgi:chemotaxis signal transduction protein